jgi:uncharacterized membrane protein YgdD (TMEM256/DUF423 family)
MSPSPCLIRIAALLGLIAVALGAAGAHGGVHDLVVAKGYLEQWKTAVFYHLVHTVVLLVLAFVGGAVRVHRIAWWSFFGGIIFFSGSLYILSLTGIKWLGAITPIGGLMLMLGWLLTAARRAC